MKILSSLLALVLVFHDQVNWLYEINVLPIPSLLTLLMIFTLLIAVIQRGAKLFMPPFFICLFLFLVVSLFSSVNYGHFNELSFLHFVVYIVFSYLLYISFLVGVLSIQNVGQVFVNINVLIAVAYIFFVVFHNVTGTEALFPMVKIYPEHSMVRVSFIYNEPLLMGLYFISALAFSEQLGMAGYKTKLLILGVLCSLSVSSFLLLAVYFSYKLLSSGNRLSIARIWYLLALSIIGVSLLAYMLGDRLDNILNLSDGSTRMRLSMMLSSLAIIEDYPLIGVGLGNSTIEMSKYTNEFSSSLNQDVAYSSNLYLSIFSEVGFAGGSLFMLALWFVYSRAKSLDKIRKILEK